MVAAPEQMDADGHTRLGAERARVGDLEAAATEFRTAIRLDARHMPAHLHLAELLLCQSQTRQAGKTLQEAQPERGLPPEGTGPSSPAVTAAFKDLVRLLEAIRHFRAALDLKPMDSGIHARLAEALRRQGRLDEAIDHFRRAISIDPSLEAAHSGLADAMVCVGRVEEFIDYLEQLLERQPQEARLHSSLLMALHYRETRTPKELFEEHKRFGLRHASPAVPGWRPKGRNPDPDRPLRLGYLSPDFRAHSVAYFIEPLIGAHDREQFEVFCYANVASGDAVTDRLKVVADGWRDVHRMSDDELVEAIRADEVDILIDLAGHTRDNRMLALARRAAPVQVTYLGYPNTTGVPTIDYRLTDDWADPQGDADTLCTERLIRLDSGFLCYRPPRQAPSVGDLPAGQEGRITFASFNNLSKLSPRTIACWAALLKRLPDSGLVLKAQALDYAVARQTVHDQFRAHGVGPEQLQLLPPDGTTSDHLQHYNGVDIALDTFPYNGTTTTCEALWMGVPVVGLAGSGHVSRVGVSLLSQVGLSELIAPSTSAYIDLAVALAGDRPRLTELRAGLRQRMSASALCDAPSVTRSIEAAYRGMWRAWARTADSAQWPRVNPVPLHRAE